MKLWLSKHRSKNVTPENLASDRKLRGKVMGFASAQPIYGLCSV
jgi:hypothetical protein